MEELLIGQTFDLLVQPIQQRAVALVDSGCNGVYIAQGVNANGEARVGQRPSQHLGVVGGECIAAAIQQCVVSVGILVILLEGDVGIVLGEVGFCGGALADDQGLASRSFTSVITLLSGETTPRETFM